MPHDGDDDYDDDDDDDGGDDDDDGGDDDGGGDDGSSGGGDDGLFPWSHQIQPVVLGAFRPSKIRRTLTSLDRSKIDPSLLGFKDWLNVEVCTILFVLSCGRFRWLHSDTEPLLVVRPLGRSTAHFFTFVIRDAFAPKFG